MLAYIYHITNKINGKKYIGKTTNFSHRLECHFNYLKRNIHHSHKLQRACNKYGIENFEVDYQIVEVKDEEELNLLEELEICKYDSYNSGYNETLGGDGNKTSLDFDTRVLIYNILKKYDGVIYKISKYFHCDESTISCLKKDKVYENIKVNTDDLKNLISKIGIGEENLKENYIPHNKKKLNKEDVFEILSVIRVTEGYDKILAKIFNVGPTIIHRLRNNISYKNYLKEYDEMSEEEKTSLYNQTFKKYNLESLKIERSRVLPLTQEQVNYILDHKSLPRKEIAEILDISIDRVKDVCCERSYKQLIKNYYNSRG